MREEPPPPRRRSLAVRAGVLVLAAAIAWVLLLRAPGPGEISSTVVDDATAAGCRPPERPVLADPSREHLSPGDPFTYEDPPAAAGPHDPTPLPPDPHVYDAPVSETRAVHNLEHAYVLLWYRPSADGGPTADVISRLEALAREQSRVIMAPYPSLPEGIGLALTAWNTRWECPGSLDADLAARIATAFIDAYRGTTNAPEAPRGLLGPLYMK